MIKKLSLSQRLIILIFIGLVINSWLIMLHSEAVIEGAILDQVKQQALVFLHGLSREIRLTIPELNREKLDQLLKGEFNRSLNEFGFSIDRLYIYDSEGNIIADTSPGRRKKKDMHSYYGDVIRETKSYLGKEVENYIEPVTGRSVAKTDVIIPFQLGKRTVAAIEMEINLNETIDEIKRLDDEYERKILLMLFVSVSLMLAFIWWVTHRGLIAPIRKLSTVTRRIANGDLSGRTDNLADTEIDRLGRDINKMADSIEQLFREQEVAYLQAIHSLAKALEAKDAYTAGHSERVAEFAVKLGKEVKLPDDQLELLKQGAFVHDLGKIGIPEAILNKSGPLDDREVEIFRKHPVMTAQIMQPLKRFKEFSEIAAWHHERWDGKGYPDGLKGEEIPLLARIVSIADTWDAMTGDRVYRKGMSIDKAISIIKEEVDYGQWDPNLIGAFIKIIYEEQAVQQIQRMNLPVKSR